MSMNELNATARDLMSVRQMIEQLQAEAEALTDKIKAAMIDQGTEVLQGDGWKASWKNVSSNRFDSKAFKADYADLYGQYSKATTTTRFKDGRKPTIRKQLAAAKSAAAPQKAPAKTKNHELEVG